MKKKILYIITSILVIIFLCLLIQFIRIKTAKIEVVLKENMTVDFLGNKKVSDFIKSINGNIIDDYKIDTTTVGKKTVEFKFKNNDNIKVKYSYEIEVVDKVAPLIWLNSSYRVKKDSDIDLTEKILCGDNYDSKPKCYIEGDYDLKKEGNYSLVFKAIDSSGNETSKPFNLNVYEPVVNKNKQKVEKEYTDFQDVIKNYKTEKNKIGIDVSAWQGDIDFEKIKSAGVEFMFIRVGGGTNGEYFLDKKFKQNIENANKYGIDVGIYFYSHTKNISDAKKDANWVISQIKDYKVNLPIVFDWEEWSSFNGYNLSFFGLTSVMEEFLKTVEKVGYKGMMYSSKSYLESIWFETKYATWLAHYTKNTDYKGKYKYWQMCDDGKIDGINGNVDIDIMISK